MWVLSFLVVFFLSDVAWDFFTGTENKFNTLHLIIETLATVTIFGVLFLLNDYVRLMENKEKRMVDVMENMRSGIMQVMHERLRTFGLTPSEYEIGIMIVKGYELPEIASLRGTSIGTIKSQCHSLYQKADVSSRASLLCMCLDEVLGSRAQDHFPSAK